MPPKANLYQEYVQKGQVLADLGRQREKAIAQIRRAEETLSSIADEYEQARNTLKELVGSWEEGDPLNLLSIGQDNALERARSMIASSQGQAGTRSGRGKNQAAILRVLAESEDGLTQAAIVEKVKKELDGGSDPSIIQATGKLYKEGKIKRTGKRGSFLYWSLDREAEPTTIKPGEDLSKEQQQRLAEVSAE